MVSKSGGNASLANESELWVSLISPDSCPPRDKDSGSPAKKWDQQRLPALEDRVSIARWNPKGLRRVTGL